MDKEFLLNLYSKMAITRLLEQKLAEALKKGVMEKGALFPCIGEEAVGVGATAALRQDDFITCYHRSQAQYVGKGGDIKKLAAEIMGKLTGYSHGKSGSSYIADLSIGILGGTGIVGSMLAVAVGEGLSFQLRGTDQVVVAFFGDGAVCEGIFHESINLAALWKVPVIFLCVNNQWCLTAPVSETISVKNVADMAHGYGIPGFVVDGNDVLAVYKTTRRAVERARAQKGPTLIEAKTYRLSGGFGGSDKGGYWDPKVLEKWKKTDPLIAFRNDLVKKRKIATEEDVKNILKTAEKLADEAIDFAAKSPYPLPEALYEGLYVDM